MTRDDLWTSFIDLISAYAASLNESDVDAFIVGMLPNPTGRTHDPAFAATYRKLVPEEEISDLRRALIALAGFVDEELVGWWKIPAARKISGDLRVASTDPESAPEPVRSWVRSLTTGEKFTLS